MINLVYLKIKHNKALYIINKSATKCSYILHFIRDQKERFIITIKFNIGISKMIYQIKFLIEVR